MPEGKPIRFFKSTLSLESDEEDCVVVEAGGALNPRSH